MRLRTILGRPRKSSANPARATSATTRRDPEFETRIVVRPLPRSVTCAGDAVSATGGRVVLAPAEAGTSTRATTAIAAAAITGR
jgi:hypothetical protein